MLLKHYENYWKRHYTYRNQKTINGITYYDRDDVNSGKTYRTNVGADIFDRGLCLPSDNKMTPEQQDVVIAIIRSCFE